jgi:carbonic anhydrase/acetyltransferase-like protein (isoleucine patch superfamily)
MIIRHRNSEPVIDPSTYVAPTAVLAGNVRVGPRSRIMYGAVLDSEGSSIEVQECSIICENAVVRATSSGNEQYRVLIGGNVFIGPQSTVLGCTIEPCSYLATGVTILHGARIKSGAVVAVGALVHANTVIPEDFFLPPNTIAIGDPVQVYSPDEKEALAKAVKSVNFANVAFNIDVHGKDRTSIYRETTEVRSREFGEHMNDSIID